MEPKLSSRIILDSRRGEFKDIEHGKYSFEKIIIRSDFGEVYI